MAHRCPAKVCVHWKRQEKQNKLKQTVTDWNKLEQTEEKMKQTGIL